MIYDISILREYEDNKERIAYYAEKSYQLYKDIRSYLKFNLEAGLPIIGNPALTLESQVLMLFYSMMQHQINCDLYSDLISTENKEQGLRMQLISLYEITNVVSTTYHDYLGEWKSLKAQQERSVLKISKWSKTA